MGNNSVLRDTIAPQVALYSLFESLLRRRHLLILLFHRPSQTRTKQSPHSKSSTRFQASSPSSMAKMATYLNVEQLRSWWENGAVSSLKIAGRRPMAFRRNSLSTNLVPRSVSDISSEREGGSFGRIVWTGKH